LQTPEATTSLWTVLDAQRHELFAAKFVQEASGALRMIRDTSIISQEAWLADLQSGDRVTGTALSRLASRVPHGIEFVPQHLWQPMAEAIGQVAWRDFQSGRRDDLWQLTPKYYRASAAEEKLSS
jgi:tRNA A37 threonylcarbamoyladenosine modification protein TsaB